MTRTNLRRSLGQLATRSGGFSLVELMVTVGIIGLLATMAMSRYSQVARESEAKAQIASIRKAVDLMRKASGIYPTGGATKKYCGDDDELWDLNACEAGIVCNDGTYDNWEGPYMDEVPPDPWGRPYYIDNDFVCGPAVPACEGISSGQPVAVVGSLGENGVQDYGNAEYSDDIVSILCKP